MSVNNVYPKICGVCGDKAFGRNFCALSCESCKIFFRRNANNLNKLKCLFENNCEMDVEMRTDCRKCRLEKCFAIGMRKEVLLTDEEKEEKKLKMQKNKQLFAVKNNTNKLDYGKIYTSTDTSSTPSMIVSSEETSILFEFLDNNNISKETLDLQIRELEDILLVESNSSAVTALSTNCDTIPTHIICHTFNESEGMKFNELMAATYDQLFETIPIITSEVSDVSEGIQMMTIRCESAVKEQIKRFNNFTAFGNMCENDRILLAKGSATQLACMRSTYFYHHDQEQWTFPEFASVPSFRLPLKVFKNNSKHISIYSQTKSMYEMSCDLASDKNILHLCTAIVLFNTNHPNITHKKNVKFQLKVYIHLLQRYLLMKYQTESVAKERFAKLLDDIKNMRHLAQECIKYILNISPPDISPLLNEICDRDCPQNA